MHWDTERLRIDDLREVDAPTFFQYRADPQIGRYQGWLPATPEHALQFIRAQARTAADARGQWQQRAIRLLGEPGLIGDLGWFVPDALDGDYEFGITLHVSQHGQGYAREALDSLLGKLFGQYAARRVIASVDPRNLPSMRLLQSLGLRQEAHFRERFLLRGEWVDDVIFALLRAEWPPAA